MYLIIILQLFNSCKKFIDQQSSLYSNGSVRETHLGDDKPVQSSFLLALSTHIHFDAHANISDWIKLKALKFHFLYGVCIGNDMKYKRRSFIGMSFKRDKT